MSYVGSGALLKRRYFTRREDKNMLSQADNTPCSIASATKKLQSLWLEALCSARASPPSAGDPVFSILHPVLLLSFPDHYHLHQGPTVGRCVGTRHRDYRSVLTFKCPRSLLLAIDLSVDKGNRSYSPWLESAYPEVSLFVNGGGDTSLDAIYFMDSAILSRNLYNCPRVTLITFSCSVSWETMNRLAH